MNKIFLILSVSIIGYMYAGEKSDATITDETKISRKLEIPRTPQFIKLRIESYITQLKKQSDFGKQKIIIDKLMTYLRQLAPHELSATIYQFPYFTECFAETKTPLGIHFVEIPSSTEPDKTERKLGVLWSDSVGQAFLSSLLYDVVSTEGLDDTHKDLVKYFLVDQKALCCRAERTSIQMAAYNAGNGHMFNTLIDFCPV
jgi:hypothetical protein